MTRKARINSAGLALLVSALPAPTATAQVSLTKKSPSKINTAYTVTAGFKPIYYEDPGQNLQQNIALSYSPSKKMSLKLSGSLLSVNNPEPATYVEDTSLTVASNGLFNLGKANISILATGSIPHLRPYTPPLDLLAKSLGVLSIEQSVNNNLSFGSRLGYRKYWFKHTLDADGNAHRNYDLITTAFLSLTFGKKFFVELSASSINRFNYFGKHTDLYDTALEAGSNLNSHVQLFAGIGTSTEQIKDRTRASPKLFASDLTEAFAGMKYLL